MGAPRPTDPNPSQAQQAVLLTESGNGPTTPDEAALLAAKFGQPNSAGVYGAPTTGGNPA
ncbi:hypothetical protein [Streptomyces sp. NRRL S-350]|uniref:hypothetical protein n=1 Tax=Streptomyces sp. NRRL S-350 TaxID=1463902 RepID=UPI0004BEC1B6|nr:hypothetical protein [Streptomyces sp. NRRL S-350]